MIGSGGSDFDFKINYSNSSSEDDHLKRGNYSNRSDTSSISTDSCTSDMAGNYDIEYTKNPQILRQKRLVMNEIKRKVFSSDSERENDCFEVDDIYGKTPPREIRRAKLKNKCNVRFNANTQFPIRKTERKHHDRKSCPPSLSNGSFQFNWQKHRDEQRKEQRKEKIEVTNLNNQEVLHENVPRSSKLIRVNSAKSLKSIGQQRSVNFVSKREEFITPKLMTNAFKLETSSPRTDNLSRKSSRHHFHKSLSLLVNLGGRIPSHSYDDQEIHKEEDDENLQVEFCEMLWLELQAWRSGQSIEITDNFLEEARQNVESILDEVINYKFVYKGSNANLCPMTHKDENISTFSSGNENDNEGMIVFKTSYDQRQEEVPLSTDHEGDSQDDSDGMLELINRMNLQDNASDLPNDANNSSYNMLTLSKKKKVAAMRDIMQLIKKVDSIEVLYPSMRALSKAHPKYESIKFKRNMEIMLLWLSINKDMYHKVNLLANLIDIDPEDIITWKDWYDHGLDLPCMKTRQSYQTSHNITTAEHLENSGSLGSLLTNFALRRSKREKRKRISQNRLSLIEKTATSRYRLFVEWGIRDKQGIIGLMEKVRSILHDTIIKSRFLLITNMIPEGKVNKEECSNLHEMRKIYKQLLLRSDVEIPEVEIDCRLYNELKQRDSSEYLKSCEDLCLPSFVDTYWFLKMIPFDVVHECLRFRLEYKPKVEPSHHSIRQLINECKDVVTGGVLCRYSLTDLLYWKIWEEKVGYMADRMEEFNDDLTALLNLYLEYLQNWFHMMQKSKQASRDLKNVIEQEWSFAKQICPFIKSGEARAGYKYCVLVSGLLKSTETFLETSVDECYSQNNPNEDSLNQRTKMLTACRQYKEIFREVHGRAITALGFAKMLQKDLGIASKYKMKVSFEEVLKALRDSRHHKVEYHGLDLDFDIFVSEACSKKEKFCTQLINLTFGYDDSDSPVYHEDGYVLFLPKQQLTVDGRKASLWLGRCCSFELTPEASLAFSYVEEVKYITLICKNSFHLNTQRKRFEQIMANRVVVCSEHTSSHNVIAKALHELKVTTKTFAQVLINAVEHVTENLNMNVASEMDEADRNSTHKSCIETMHSCFSVGFEYLRECVRMYHGSNTHGIRNCFLQFARMWMQFVMCKTDRGRGTKPRWAVPGMEFLLATIDPQHTEQLSDEEFLELQLKMNKCIKHIIGKAEPRHKTKTKAEKRSSSPFTVHRSRSVPSTKRAESNLLDTPSMADTRYSLPNYFHKSSSTNVDLNSSTHTSDNDTIDSIPSEYDEDGIMVDEDDGEENEPPLIRVRNALQEIDERRTAKLQHMRVIGNVTYKKANFASELVHNVRRVNFKWQLGNKIGEGQYGKVYSAVNLDTGDLMAVKQIRFNPHDYGTIQEIADEITNIQGLMHDSLVKYFGVELHKDEMLIFMEYCADGTIAEVAKVGLPESIIRVYTYQTTKAINFLHQNGIVHRDIKGANIFVSSSGIIKIGDFGSAVKLKDPMCTSQGEVFNTRGTAAYMAPEVITLDKGTGYGRAADIWSLGCVVYEMTTGKQPWYDLDNIYAIMYRVGDGNHPPIPDRLSEEGQDFLACCFIQDQNSRWTAHMLEDHQFVKCC